MMKCAFVVLLALSGSAFAQGLDTPASTLVRPTSFSALPTIYAAPRPITLWDQQPFCFRRSFGWMSATPAQFLPQFLAFQAPQRLAPEPEQIRSDRGGMADLLPKVDYAGGEVGIFFGKSIDGRINRETKGGYILGDVISGKTQISVGASYLKDTFSR